MRRLNLAVGIDKYQGGFGPAAVDTEIQVGGAAHSE
jgi:hypothetical protein